MSEPHPSFKMATVAKKNMHKFASTRKDNTLSKMNDNINMDSTITGPVNDNINMDSTITVWTLVVNWLLAKKIGSVGERPLLWVRHHRLAGLYNKRTKKSLKISVVVMMFNATFNNISVISWQSVLLVEETGVTRRKSLTFRKSLTNWTYQTG